jgi:glycosyltransferase involved in cell wall biosynthesis
MKVIIVMTYFERQRQLNQTLKSIKSEHKDFEVVIVDDCSRVEPAFVMQDFPITLIKMKNKQWIDGSPAYNAGILYTLSKDPDVIILQNAETYHVGDIIKYATTVTDQTYISFACYNLSKETTKKHHDINEVIKQNNNHAVNNEDNAWLNHKTIRQMGYHWCSAITAANIRKLNGFDERFSEGYCFEDDEFLARVKMLGLKVEITSEPFVVHQWHSRSYVPSNWQELYNRNRRLFEQIRDGNNPVAIHNFTENFNV